MKKKPKEYDDVKNLAEDIQKNLDALATGLQNRIHILYNRLHNMNFPQGPYEYNIKATQCNYEIDGLANALDKLNEYFKNFRTNYEYIDGYIAEHDTKPVRREQRKG